MEEPIRIGRRIAYGTTSTVHELPDEPGRVIKLLLPRSVGYAQQELHRMRMIHLMGVPAPKAHRVEMVDKRDGIVYDKVEGERWEDYVGMDFERGGQIAREMAAIHASIHSKEGLGLPEDSNAEGPLCLCHERFHPGSIVRTDAGAVVLSWGLARRGSAIADVARTMFYLLMVETGPRKPMPIYHDSEGEVQIGKIDFASEVWSMAKDPPDNSWFIVNRLRGRMAAIYLQEYERITGIERQAVMSKLVSMAEGHWGTALPWERYTIQKICRDDFDLERYLGD